MTENDEEPTGGDVERDMRDTEAKMEREREHLADDIDIARKDLAEMERATGGEVAGDWRDTADAAGGEDPEGAHEVSEREAASERAGDGDS
jgi:hypothetical protein